LTQTWKFECDFPGNTFGEVRVAGDKCKQACQSNPKCTHFAWKQDYGGTCFLKKGDVTMDDAYPVEDLGSVCGVVPRKMIKVSTLRWKEKPHPSALSCDFPGNDLKHLPMFHHERVHPLFMVTKIISLLYINIMPFFTIVKAA